MKASDLLVRCLEAEGVTSIYGVPGEENADFMMSLEDSAIEFVLCRHEQSAAFMADVHGRLTGEASVCLGTLGPGASNLVTGVADANMDRAPLIALTGQAALSRLHKESHQNMDVVGMFEPITKWAWSISDPDSIPEVTRKAFKLATTEKPGACHIELPEDVAEHDSSAVPLRAERVRRAVPGDKVIDQVFDVLKGAKKPIILAGNGTIRRRASKQLRELAKRTGIGVLSTFMAKGCIDRNDPNCLFTVGLGAKDYGAIAIEEADVVICLGFDMVEYHPKLWNPNADNKIVHIDFLPAEVDQHYPVTVEVVGDLAHTLWMLNERLEKEPLHWDLAEHKEVRKHMLEDFAAHAEDDTKGIIRPQKMLWDLREAMDPGDILLSDVGAHKMWIARYFSCDEPNTCLISNGFCSMGFALPGAIAAKRVYPDQNVVALCGDAGFLMNVQEMETARRLNTPIVAVVWEDHEYGLIAWKQSTQFGKHTDLSFGNPDWMQLAAAFDWAGFRCDDAADLRSTLDEAFAQERPSLVVLPIDYRENALLTQRLGEIAHSL